MPLALTMRTHTPQPFANAPAGSASQAAATGNAQTGPQGEFAAHVSLTLYDANGHARAIESDRASLRGATLAKGDAAVVQVDDESGGRMTVTVRDDGSFFASSGGKVVYDSRSAADATASSSAASLADRARKIASFAISAGSKTALRDAASSDLLSQAAGSPQSTSDFVTVTVTDSDGVSRYSGTASGPVYAARSTAGVALETVTAADGVTVDAVRARDGSGSTRVDGAALGGAAFVLTRAVDGSEAIAVESAGGIAAATSAAAVSADAFGDSVTVGRGANGGSAIAIADDAGNTFALTTDGSSASLSVGVGVGGTSGTQSALLVAGATSATTTGSSVSAGTTLGATATNAERGGRLTLDVAQTVTSTSQTKDGQKSTFAFASLDLQAAASGTLDVAGAGSAALQNGAVIKSVGQQTDGQTSRDVSGAASLDRSAQQTLLDVHAYQADTDVRKTDPRDPTSSTTDASALTMHGFGHDETATLFDAIDAGVPGAGARSAAET